MTKEHVALLVLCECMRLICVGLYVGRALSLCSFFQFYIKLNKQVCVIATFNHWVPGSISSLASSVFVDEQSSD